MKRLRYALLLFESYCRAKWGIFIWDTDFFYAIQSNISSPLKYGLIMSNTGYFAELLNITSLNHYAARMKHKNRNLKTEKFSHVLKYGILEYLQLKENLLYLLQLPMLLTAKISIANLYVFLSIHLAWEKLWKCMKTCPFYSIKVRLKEHPSAIHKERWNLLVIAIFFFLIKKL